jgi:cell division septum initiation protein DivIVA
MTTPAETPREQFEIVRRGYEPQQVDRRVHSLARDLQAARQRVRELEQGVGELERQLQDATREPAARYSGLGAHIEQILGLADQESRSLLAQAAEEADQHRALAEQAAQQIRSDADRYAQERRSEAESEAARVLEDARRQSDQLRDDTERTAKSRREEAEALFEHNRAKAAKAAADFETTLAQRRDQAEHDFTEQMSANEHRLAAVAQRAEQLRLEAEKLRADAERKSKRMLEETQQQADDRVAEAKATAERIRGESLRELAAATQRRDSINAQLTNVRQMLATLTGASVANPFADDGPETEAAPAGSAKAEVPSTEEAEAGDGADDDATADGATADGTADGATDGATAEGAKHERVEADDATAPEQTTPAASPVPGSHVTPTTTGTAGSAAPEEAQEQVDTTATAPKAGAANGDPARR